MFEDYYMPEFDADYFNSPAFQQAIAAAVQQYSPPPVEPTYYAPETVAGIGRDYNYYEPDAYYGIPEETYAPAPESVYTPTVEPMTIEAEPVAGIGSPVIAAPVEVPSVIETAAAAPATPAGTDLQVINANDYSPSDTDLQTMNLTRDQWNEAMASLSNMDTKLLNNLSLDMVGKNPDATNNYRVFNAPLSNKGNHTAYNNNSFSVIQDQPIRLFDNATGKVIFEGTGYEAAEKAIELAAGLTKAGGNNADWEIQTGQFKNPGSGDLVFGDTFKPVATEKTNKSIIPEVLDILGDAALGFIIGGPVGAAIAAGASAAGVNVSDIAYPIIATAILAPTGFLAVAGAAALGSAVSSTVQGRSLEETLIRAGVTGLTAGVLGGTEVGGEVSRAVGGVLRDIGVESQVGNIINTVTDTVSGIGAEAATREIIVNAATNAAATALASGAAGSVVSEAIVDSVKNVIPDYQPSADTNAALNKVDEAAANFDPNQIVVTSNPVTNALSGVNPIGDPSAPSPAPEPAAPPPAEQPPATETPPAEEPPAATVIGGGTTSGAGIGSIIPVEIPPSTVAPEPTPPPPAEQPIEPPAEEPPVATVIGGGTNTGAGIGGIVPINTTVPTTPPPAPPATETPPAEEEPPVATVIGGGTTIGAGIGGVIPGVETLVNSPEFQEDLIDENNRPREEDRSILDTIRDVADVAIPVIGGVVGGGGGGGGTRAPDTTGLNFTKSTLRPTFTGGGNGGIGGTGGRYPYTPQTYGRAGGDQETEYLFFTRDPVTEEAAAPEVVPVAAPGKKEGGEIEDDMVKHLVEYHKNGGHQGPGQVKGIGSGQDDKIPAWLSDGEYVWSAQDVADLGDGSTDEGVRRLDKMRQMVRHQAGRKDVKKIAKPQKGIDKMLKAVGGMV
jgi:hypothetical protein